MVNVPVKPPLFTVIVAGVVCNTVLEKASIMVTDWLSVAGGKLAPVMVIESPAWA